MSRRVIQFFYYVTTPPSPLPPSVERQKQTWFSFPNLKTTPISELVEDNKNEWDLSFIHNFSSTSAGQSGHSTSIPRDKK